MPHEATHNGRRALLAFFPQRMPPTRAETAEIPYTIAERLWAGITPFSTSAANTAANTNDISIVAVTLITIAHILPDVAVMLDFIKKLLSLYS